MKSIEVNNENQSKSRFNPVNLILKNIIWIVLVLVTIVFSFFSPVFLTISNLMGILRQAALVGILAVGMTFAVIGGSFDLSVGMTLGLATVIVIKTNPQDLPSTLLIVAIALLAGLVVGLINGILVGKFQINSMMTTIGMKYIVWGVILIYTKAQHIWAPNLYVPFRSIGTGNLGIVPISVIVFALTVFVGQFILGRTKFGRYLYATGGNQTAAFLSGINVVRVKLMSFIISGLGAAITGIVIAARVGDVDPSFGNGREFDALTAVVLGGTSLMGGKGSVIGTLAGVLLLGIITNAMTILGFSINYQLMTKAIILILAVAADVIFSRRRGKRNAS
jgi:ribose/xylose/arabinose/galactoside ABC-type transport system permease subunit